MTALSSERATLATALVFQRAGLLVETARPSDRGVDLLVGSVQRPDLKLAVEVKTSNSESNPEVMEAYKAALQHYRLMWPAILVVFVIPSERLLYKWLTGPTSSKRSPLFQPLSVNVAEGIFKEISNVSSAVFAFTRAKNIKGFLSSSDVGTDALNAVASWAGREPERDYEDVCETDVEIRLRLRWRTTDRNAGHELDLACHAAGVARTFIPQA